MSKLITFIIFALLAEVAIAQFHDQGFQVATSRTDFNSQTEAQPSNPLTYVSPCLYPGQICGTTPTTFSSTNSFFQNVQSWPSSDYWVLNFNNENSYDKVCPLNPDPDVSCPPGQILAYTQNPGPANQSIPRSPPGYGLMGYTSLIDSEAGEDFYRAHLVMNGTFPNPATGGIPYMSIGAEAYRGNGGVLGYLNLFSRNTLTFNARLWRAELPSPVGNQPAVLVFYVLVMSEWQGKRRGLFITLAHWNYDNSSSNPGDFEHQFKWNWPMLESFYYPGAEFALIDAEDMQFHCGVSVPRLTSVGQEIAYNLNLWWLFQCISNLNGWDSPMPSFPAPAILGVHWAVEMTGENGKLWTSVHDMQLNY